MSVAGDPVVPRSRRRGSVRARATVGATLIFGVTLAIGAGAMVTLLQRSLVRNLDGVADVRADDIAALVRDDALPKTLALEDDGVGQVVDADGRVLAASPNLRTDSPITTTRPTGTEPVNRTTDDIPGVSGEYRLLALRAASPSGPVSIYVGTNLEPVQDTLSLVRTSLVIGAPLLLVLVAGLTWATVGRALQPVEAIRSQVADLSSKDLHRRVPVPPTRDEIGRLAITMNAMLDRLQGAAERQQRFVADASHELQTPIAAARADLEVALAHPQATEWLETARDLLDENRRMEHLVADLLFIARIDAATPPSPPCPVDMHEIVLDEVARLAPSDRVRVDTSDVASAFVLGRRDDLARVVRNLLANAERYATSAVTIGLRDGDGSVNLVIQDDGPGIAPEHRERIFERFTRLDDARSRRSGGSGLGLAIVKDIVDRHRGRVTVEDCDLGACFVVTLPPG